jgi:hypothetical protein
MSNDTAFDTSYGFAAISGLRGSHLTEDAAQGGALDAGAELLVWDGGFEHIAILSETQRKAPSSPLG